MNSGLQQHARPDRTRTSLRGATPDPPAGAADQEAVGLKSHALGRRLLDDGSSFDYFQALYVLERLLPADPASSSHSTDSITAITDRVRVRASATLAFPPTDILGVHLASRSSHPNPVAVVTATFMGLYGVDSPLPVSYREGVLRNGDRSSALRAFLDIFDRRLYAFFYRTWRKQRPALRMPTASTSSREPVDSERPFLSLTGCGAGPAASGAPVAPLRLASFASLLARRTRSAHGLQTLVSGLLDGLPVTVKENVSRWISIGAPPGLGHQGARLSVDAHLGRQIRDRSSTFRLSIGPVDIDTYQRLLPGEPLARRLAWLVDLYVTDVLAYDVELVLCTDTVDELRLGNRAKLGQSTFLGDGGMTVTRVVSYDDR